MNSQEHTEFFLKVIFGFAIFAALTMYAVSTKTKKNRVVQNQGLLVGMDSKFSQC